MIVFDPTKEVKYDSTGVLHGHREVLEDVCSALCSCGPRVSVSTGCSLVSLTVECATNDI